MANYIVTGAAGFIGSRVSEMLLDDGHFVLGIDNLNDAYDVQLKQYRLSQLTNRTDFSFCLVDISNFAQLKKIFEPGSSSARSKGLSPAKRNYDAVINLAARAGVRQSVANPWVYIETNVTGTLNLLEICHALAIPKFVLASSSSVYGENAPLPTPESTDTNYPLQPYAATKKGAEALCHAYHFLYGIDMTIFRYFTVYGPAGRPDMSVFRFVHWISEGLPVLINGDGEQSRGYTYIDDIARGTILGLIPLGYEVINLGGHETIKINQLIQMLEEIIGLQARVEHHPANPADMRANWADVNKAKQLLNWQPQINLHQGIQQTVAWYQQARTLASKIHYD